MKRKDLYNYIKEEIVNTLSEESVAWTSSTKSQAKQHIDKSKLDSVAKKAAKDEIDQTPSGLISNVSEMANVASAVKIQDPAKFALAKEIYTGGRTAAVLAAIEEAGEEGLTQKQLGEKLGIQNDSELNPIIANLRASGAVTGKREKMEKPEQPTTSTSVPSTGDEGDEWENAEETTDDWEKSEEEEKDSSEEEPKSVNDKEVEKTVDKIYSDISPEEEEKYNLFKKAIINKAKIINDKKSSAIDKAKAKAAIDSYKSKEDIKNLFTKKGLKLIDFINSELNK